ncbi:NAD(P)H-binding protein [Paenibacillus prosopidis]|uniref:Putative NAD(P)-binding protein n=1 Tax=Paenibacillus prosopidis TaxID=630520 RepID=A0A368W1D5_9BACL|nr:NAD(P)H-binding protein [Paenibacillus prosopidis]RCW48421.1 putative NAD(P)-binding protein [Paenibacillus prosopidis]
MMNRTALVLGATGLIGEQLVKLLLQSEEYVRVTALVRSPLPYSHPKLYTVIVDFARLEDFAEEIVGQDVFCCLGTTIVHGRSTAQIQADSSRQGCLCDVSDRREQTR